MKRTIMTAVIAACMTLTASAQDKKNDISLSVGTMPIPYIIDNCMTFNASYMHTRNDYVSLGGTVGYSHGDMTNHDDFEKKVDGDCISAMASVRAYWFRNDGCRLYSSASLGVQMQFRRNEVFLCDDNPFSSKPYVPMLEIEHETKVVPAVQLSPIGLELGGETVKAFAELGLGAQGLAQAGVRVRF